MSNVNVTVTFPVSKQTRNFKSIRAVARMLSGTGKASGGFRKTISQRALNGLDFGDANVVRGHELAG